MQDVSRHIDLALSRTEEESGTIGSYTLTSYQLFTSRIFLGLQTLRKLLLFWDTGYGKTLGTIFIIKNLRVLYPNWQVILMVKAALHHDPWLNTINKLIENTNNITIIHYDDPNSFFLLQKKIKDINANNTRILFIIDECHNFISRSLFQKGKKRVATKSYDLILRTLRDTKHRLLLISATPVINSLLEFNALIKLLRPLTPGVSDSMFHNGRIVSRDKYIYNLSGSVSYNRLNEEESLENTKASINLPSKNIIFKDLAMSESQSKVYREAYANEVRMGGDYKSGRRMAATFVYRGTKPKNEEEMRDRIASLYEEFNKFYFSKEFLKAFKEDKEMEYFQVMSKIKEEEYNAYNNLRSYSIKYIEAIRTILKSPGKTSIYEPFVSYEGISSLRLYLDIFRVTNVVYSQNKGDRVTMLEKYNNTKNENGEEVKTIIFTKAGSEGITFKGCNDIIIMDIPWSDALLRQIIGRCVRLNSHSHLSENRRYVNVTILLAYDQKGNSVDKEMLTTIQRKNSYITELYNILKESSFEYIRSNQSNSSRLILELEEEFIFDTLDKNKIEPQFKEDVIRNLNLRPILYSINDFQTVLEGFLNPVDYRVYNKLGDRVGSINNLESFEIVGLDIVYNIVSIIS